MKKVLSIFAFVALLFTGACGTIDPATKPQPNQYYTAPANHEARTYDNGYDHFGKVFRDLAVAVPSNAMISVSWDLIPENDRRKAQRRNCAVHIKDEFGIESTRYRCLSVERNAGDFVVAFEVQTEKGKVVKELNLSFMSGGFIEGEMYERPFNFLGMNWEYGSTSSKQLRIVWSTHEPIRWR